MSTTYLKHVLFVCFVIHKYVYKKTFLSGRVTNWCTQHTRPPNKETPKGGGYPPLENSAPRGARATILRASRAQWESYENDPPSPPVQKGRPNCYRHSRTLPFCPKTAPGWAAEGSEGLSQNYVSPRMERIRLKKQLMRIFYVYLKRF